MCFINPFTNVNPYINVNVTLQMDNNVDRVNYKLDPDDVLCFILDIFFVGILKSLN